MTRTSGTASGTTPPAGRDITVIRNRTASPWALRSISPLASSTTRRGTPLSPVTVSTIAAMVAARFAAGSSTMARSAWYGDGATIRTASVPTMSAPYPFASASHIAALFRAWTW